MGQLTLPYIDHYPAEGNDAVFELTADKDGVAIRGVAGGVDQDGNAGGPGVEGLSTQGGLGVAGHASGHDRYSPGVGVSGDADSGGVGVSGTASGTAPNETATGVYGFASEGGIGIEGDAEGNENATGVLGSAKDGGVGVRGDADGARTAVGVHGSARDGGQGVVGDADGPGGVGVYGVATHGPGVLGTALDPNQPGVLGNGLGFAPGVQGTSAKGFAMFADGPTGQALDQGGWVKAMAHIAVSKLAPVPTLDRWFNANGFGNDKPLNWLIPPEAVGVYLLDFGFSLRKRFVVATPDYARAWFVPSVPENRLTQDVKWNPDPNSYIDAGLDARALGDSQNLDVPLVMTSIHPWIDTLLQVECFALKWKPTAGGAGSADFVRANKSVTVVIF